MQESSEDPRELQAAACLKAGEVHGARLLAVARKLAGSDEGGRCLLHSVLLDCHDAIQRVGFPHGDRYEFYILTAIRRTHYKESKRAGRIVPLDDRLLGEYDLDQVDDKAWTGGLPARPRALPQLIVTEGPAVSEHDFLAAQVQEEIRARFSPADRLAFRLHIDGESYRDISALVGGGDHSWISRRVAKMKTALREAFGQAWANLNS